MECTTYEGLLNCLKFLDAHIDKSVSFSFLVTTFISCLRDTEEVSSPPFSHRSL